MPENPIPPKPNPSEVHKEKGVGSAATCSLIIDVARFMAYANARGRFNAVAESAEKEAIIKADGEANAHRWQASAKVLLSMNGHLKSENAQCDSQIPVKKL